MPLDALLRDAGWDAPFFKVLAHNDTAAAAGHQAGIVVPKAIRSYFPGLLGTPSATAPTADVQLTADLYIDTTFVETVDTRFQYQTWGGTRRPEYRVTSGLSKIRTVASSGDVLIAQRALLDLTRFRFILVKKSSSSYPDVIALIAARRSGPVVPHDRPVAVADLDGAEADESAAEAAPFRLFDLSAAVVTSTVYRVARSIAFQKTVLEIYGHQCCVCGTGLRRPGTKLTEIDAAHVVPRGKRGADDARNGIAFCKSHHWAFDNGLIGVLADFRVVVPPIVLGVAGNANLGALDGTLIRLPSVTWLRPDLQALEWHRAHVLMH